MYLKTSSSFVEEVLCDEELFDEDLEALFELDPDFDAELDVDFVFSSMGSKENTTSVKNWLNSGSLTNASRQSLATSSGGLR